MSSLATRIIELSASGINNFSGTYEEYLSDVSENREQVLNEASQEDSTVTAGSHATSSKPE